MFFNRINVAVYTETAFSETDTDEGWYGGKYNER